MRLSVIVPVYNMASDNRLNYCMDSLVHQTSQGSALTDYEILAVDDCSTDDSYEILRDYERRYPALVRSLQTPRNLHQGGAKNLALQQAQGEWIAFIDADDWVVPDYFARLLTLAMDTGADCVGCDLTLVSEHGTTPGVIVHSSSLSQTGELDEARKRSLMVDFGSLCTKIYRREIILGCDSRFPEDMFYEDNAISRTWISRMHHFEYIPEPLYFYYQHEDSTVHTVSIQRLEDRKRAGRMMLEEAKRYGYYERFLPELEYDFTVLFYQNTLFSAMRQLHGSGKRAFVTVLGREMKQTFPDFGQNPYYVKRTDPEEKKYMAMQMEHPLRFYLQYQALLLYRRIRAGRKQ